MNECILVDVDGTLSDPTHRLHHVQKTPPDWESFLDECKDDLPNKDIIRLHQILDAGRDNQVKMVIVSARPNDRCQLTKQWLQDHNVDYDELFMREAGDYRRDDVVKKEILDKIREKYTILFAVDDRPRIVDLWRRNGITCLHCTDRWEDHSRDRSPTLTLLVGPTGAGKDYFIDNNFIDRSEVVSSDKIREEICGDFADQSKNDEVFEICHELVRTRLKLGLNVYFNATNLKNKDRKAVLDLATPTTEIQYVVLNRPVEFKKLDGDWRNEVLVKGEKELIDYHEERFNSQLDDILAGDYRNDVEVIDYRC